MLALSWFAGVLDHGLRVSFLVSGLPVVEVVVVLAVVLMILVVPGVMTVAVLFHCLGIYAGTVCFRSTLLFLLIDD